MLFVHTYLTDPRCWSFVLSTVALQMVALHPETLTIRQVSPAPVGRTCNALILKPYPEENIISALLQCMDEFVAEQPHLKKSSHSAEGVPTIILYRKNRPHKIEKTRAISYKI